ncbi:hypothetical protein LB505_005919 [Fusarium chuoi]|nr:hypothetical protein LB505_005919 [Fusarium chuoi]
MAATAVSDQTTDLSKQYDTPLGLAHSTMQVLKDRIKLHYDLASDYYLRANISITGTGQRQSLKPRRQRRKLKPISFSFFLTFQRFHPNARFLMLAVVSVEHHGISLPNMVAL